MDADGVRPGVRPRHVDALNPPDPRSDGIVELSLVTKGQNPDLVAFGHEPVQRHVSRSAERDDDLAQLAADEASDQWVSSKRLDRALNRLRGGHGCLRIVLRQEVEGSLEVRKRVARVDYLRHGLGRPAFFPLASRWSQA